MELKEGLPVRNEVKAGYKNTEVGVIPEDWEIGKLEDLATKIGSGITPTGGSTVYKEDGRPFVRSQNIGWGHLLLDDIAYIDDDTHQTFPNTEIKLNDVFLNISGASIGRSSYANYRLVGGNVNQHVCIIRTIENKLNPTFLNLFLISNRGQKQIDSFQSGGNRQGLNIGQIRTFQIPIPPTLEEQTAIATALSAADALINSLEKLIVKKRNIKQGAMQKLLQPKEGDDLSLSKGWEVKKLGEIALVTMGQSPLSSYYNSEGIGLPLVQGNADVENRKTIIRFYTSMITKKGKSGDIIMSVRAPVGEISKATFECCRGRGVCSISFDNEYLYHYLIHFEKSWAKHSTGSTFDSVNSKQVKDLEIPIPIENTEQTRIATILSDMDAEIQVLETKLDKYRNIKLGMMQNLLTGKIRLI